MYAKRTDANHTEIADVFRQMLAGHVTDSSRWGQGAGDLFVSYGDFGCFVEIKTNEKKKLTKAQEEFKVRHPGQWFRCESVEGAIYLCKRIREKGTA